MPTVIPFGPQHPVLPEPLQLKLIIADDKVVEALPSLGYVHRGLEKLAEIKDFTQTLYIVERVCGICSFMHSMAYARAIENVMDIKIPERAEFIRTIFAEVSRVQSHLLWLGFLADAIGFESLFMECFKYREKVLDFFEMTTGNRIIISANKIGGIKKDLCEDHISMLSKLCLELKPEIKELENVFLKNYTVKKRLVDKGILNKEDIESLSAVGPVAKGSGIPLDLRTTGYSAYKYLSFSPIVVNNCDCYGRTVVRIKEIYQSLDLILEALKLLPKGEISIPFKGFPKGEAISRIEQPRGEAIYYIKANGTKNLSRLKIRTPTFANIPSILKMLPGCELADVPVFILTIDPCISCTER